MNDEKEYAIHKRTLKLVLSHGLVLEKLHKVIKFNQEAWLKPYIEKNTELKKNANNYFKIYFFKLMNNAIFEFLNNATIEISNF